MISGYSNFRCWASLCSAQPAILAITAAVLLTGCNGEQSALAPSGVAAQEIARLWWVMASGAVIIFCIVIGTAFYAVRINPDRHSPKMEYVLILGGGVVFPLVVLASLLIYSLMLGPKLTTAVGPDALRVKIIGKQWWWEVQYLSPDGEPVISANELHIPVGEPVEVLLESTDVIHSFWVPRLAGKTDMIPGRTNRMVLHALEDGVFRGQCAEYCGGPHALMAFYVIAEPRDAFERWLDHEAQPVINTDDSAVTTGRDLFISSGCGTCHTVRGTEADGKAGPDLTHVGSRHSLAAGILPNNIGTLAGWIADAQHIKPDNLMPSFNTFDGQSLRALAAYLESLK